MLFHIEERRAWVRAHTHLVVFDRDPEFERFAKDPTGKMKLMLRIWLAEERHGEPHLRDYLGTVSFCATGPSFRDLWRLFRFTSVSAKQTGESARNLRLRLAAILREYIAKEHEARPSSVGDA